MLRVEIQCVEARQPPLPRPSPKGIFGTGGLRFHSGSCRESDMLLWAHYTAGGTYEKTSRAPVRSKIKKIVAKARTKLARARSAVRPSSKARTKSPRFATNAWWGREKSDLC